MQSPVHLRECVHLNCYIFLFFIATNLYKTRPTLLQRIVSLTYYSSHNIEAISRYCGNIVELS